MYKSPIRDENIVFWMMTIMVMSQRKWMRSKYTGPSYTITSRNIAFNVEKSIIMSTVLDTPLINAYHVEPFL